MLIAKFVLKTVAEKMKSHLLTIAQIEHENTAPDDKEVQQQMQVVRELAFEQDMLLDREARVRQIEADVLDINEIMRELGFLVNQQGEVIGKIIRLFNALIIISFNVMFFRYD